MTYEWDLTRIEQHIKDEVQESLTLEYKAADALARSDARKTEITKDVSAMANSAGGILIYGVKEYDEDDKRHLPERIDAIDQTLFSREWLEQVINGIRPRIEGVIIHPVPLESSPNRVVFVVEIPASTTAHQALDKRYYKRFNFLSVPMEDYEIRDVMQRKDRPTIQIEFEIVYAPLGTSGALGSEYKYQLYVQFANTSNTIANHVFAFVELPRTILHPRLGARQSGKRKNSASLVFKNSEPVLPGLLWRERATVLCDELDSLFLSGVYITWSIQVDDAPRKDGVTAMTNIKVSRQDKNQHPST